MEPVLLLAGLEVSVGTRISSLTCLCTNTSPATSPVEVLVPLPSWPHSSAHRYASLPEHILRLISSNIKLVSYLLLEEYLSHLYKQ